MPIEPKFALTARIATDLMRIEGAGQSVVHLPTTAAVLSTLREPEFLTQRRKGRHVPARQLPNRDPTKFGRCVAGFAPLRETFPAGPSGFLPRHSLRLRVKFFPGFKTGVLEPRSTRMNTDGLGAASGVPRPAFGAPNRMRPFQRAYCCTINLRGVGHPGEIPVSGLSHATPQRPPRSRTIVAQP